MSKAVADDDSSSEASDRAVESSSSSDEEVDKSIFKYVPCRRPKKEIGFREENTEDASYIELTVIGDVCVGKTSILKRFATREFCDVRNKTIGVDYIDFWIMSNAPDYNRKTCVKLVDTAGDEDWRCIVRSRLRSPFGIFMIFDATNSASFESLTRWSETIERENTFCCRMLVANKIDLYKKLKPEDRWMDKLNWVQERDRLLCDEGFFCVSAKEGENIDSMFVEMVDYAIERQSEHDNDQVKTDGVQNIASVTPGRPARPGVVQINNSITYKHNKNSCKC